MAKIIGQWWHLLEDNPHHGQWIGFYRDGVEVLASVLQCLADFTPHACTNTIFSCLSWLNVLQLAPIPDALVNGRIPLGKRLVFFIRLNLFINY